MVRSSRIYIALLHYPIYNKRMEIVTTSVTNLDLHDISRVARTYEVAGFYIVHPLVSQRELIGQILDYWQNGYGGEYNPDRKEAFQVVRLASTLQEVVDAIASEAGRKPYIVTTDARIYPNTVSYRYLKDKLAGEDACFLILFGTGWGLAKEVMLGADYILEPIEAGSSYNHLSVRSAVAIILDRLLGDC